MTDGVVSGSDHPPAVPRETDGQVAELRHAYDELFGRIRSQPVLNIDETPKPRKGAEVVVVDVRRIALHGLSRACDTRGHRAEELLTDPFAGVVSCERAKMS